MRNTGFEFMKYIKSFIICIVISVVVWAVSEILITRGFILTWVQLQNLPSKPVKLVGLYPGLYYTIVIKSEDGKNYYSYGGKESNWVNESESDCILTEEDIKNSSMTVCKLDDPKFVGLVIRNKQIIGCYQYYVQYPEAAADLTVVLDQNGNVWENHKWLGATSFNIVVSAFVQILLFAIVLEAGWLTIVSIKMSRLSL